jgi:hypothetical protein
MCNKSHIMTLIGATVNEMLKKGLERSPSIFEEWIVCKIVYSNLVLETLQKSHSQHLMY